MDALLVVLSGAIGLFGLSGIPRFATLVLAVPVFWCLASGRRVAFAVMLAYFLTVSRGLLPGAAVFLSENHTVVGAAALYFLLSFSVSLPFFAFWSPNARRKAFCLLAAFFTAFLLPPISLIGIANPLLAAGTIFRGLGYLGIIFTLLIFVLCALSKRAVVTFLSVVLVFTICPAESWYLPPVPSGFMAVDTSFGRMGSGSYNFSSDFERVRFVFEDLRRRDIENSDVRTIVLPETIAGRFNASGLGLWQRELGKLLGDDTAVVFGAEIPTGDGRKYDNVAILLYGDNVEIARQRIPVPYSMYRGPWAATGANLHLFERKILHLPDGKTAATVICYEAYLTCPWLVAMYDDPDAILVLANLWWCRNTSLPVTQRNMAALWGLLFGVPVVFAENR